MIVELVFVENVFKKVTVRLNDLNCKCEKGSWFTGASIGQLKREVREVRLGDGWGDFEVLSVRSVQGKLMVKLKNF